MDSFSHTADLSRGTVVSNVLRFALPLCAANVLQQLYNTVDTLIIGNHAAPVSLAAVATSGQPLEILLYLFSGLGTGVSILTAQYRGRNDPEEIRKTAAAAASFLYLCTPVLVLLGLLLGGPVLRLMNVPDDTLPTAVVYLNISMAGILPTLGYNIIAGLLRGLGDSRSSLAFLLYSCVVNIVLDYTAVAVLKWDAAGAAIATVAAQYVAWIMGILYIRTRFPELADTLKPGRPDWETMKKLLRIAIPVSMNESLYSFGHLFLQSMINLQGAVFMAGCSVAAKITGMVATMVRSVSTSCTTFSGQNWGAGHFDRLKRGARSLIPLAGLLSFALCLPVAVFCRPILELFTRDEEVLTVAVRYIRLIAPLNWMYAVLNTAEMYMNGMGVIRYPTVVSLLMLWAVRIPTGWIIERYFDGRYIMLAYPVSFFAGMIGMLSFFLTKKWRIVREKAEREKAEPYGKTV